MAMVDRELRPGEQLSTRAMWDVLDGEDPASPVLEACWSGDVTALGSMLSQPQWTDIMLQEQVCINSENRPSHNEGDMRPVMVGAVGNLVRAMNLAAYNGKAAAVSMLLGFASQQGVHPSSVITRWAVYRVCWSGRVAVFEAFAAADPEVVDFSLGHGRLPLDATVQAGKSELVALLFQLGAKLVHPCPRCRAKRETGHRASLLSQAAGHTNARTTELLLEHGASVACSGALHRAAELGALNNMHMLIRHGADVNEQLQEKVPPSPFPSRDAGWTPMHFAAWKGQVDAVKLLEAHGARPDITDQEGRTPAQLLEQRE